MKYLAIITLALAMIACENKGKKAVKEENQIEETTEAQIENVSIKGTVISANDSTPLSGAFIMIPGTTIGTMTGPDGNFLITAPEETKKLLFTMNGYETATVEVKVSEENTIYLTAKD